MSPPHRSLELESPPFAPAALTAACARAQGADIRPVLPGVLGDAGLPGVDEHYRPWEQGHGDVHLFQHEHDRGYQVQRPRGQVWLRYAALPPPPLFSTDSGFGDMLREVQELKTRGHQARPLAVVLTLQYGWKGGNGAGELAALLTVKLGQALSATDVALCAAVSSIS
eukprot:COSAG01_NODE_17332_length_1159_cov_1.364151_1_plen_168_part_00